MPSRNNEGLSEQFHRMPQKNGLAHFGNYAAGLIDAARNWTENRQMTVPGYRDRIVHIRLKDGKEGGLNLDMDSDAVREVSGRGSDAADLLRSHFFDPAPEVKLTWDNHRWIRFRSAFARFEELLEQLRVGLEKPGPGERSYLELLDRGEDDLPTSYKITGAQRTLIHQLMGRLLEAAKGINEALESVRPSHKQPSPKPVLHVVPQTVPDEHADKPGTPAIDPQEAPKLSV